LIIDIAFSSKTSGSAECAAGVTAYYDSLMICGKYSLVFTIKEDWEEYNLPSPEHD
jgi:hypothetical protein